MQRPKATFLDRLSYGLAALFTLDRLLKLIAVWHFFHRPLPPAPQPWPTVSLIQPITRGTSNLLNALRARTKLDYPATIQHILICDASDEESQAIVSSFLTEFPFLQVKIILVPSENTFDTTATTATIATSVATKIKKVQSAIPHATGEVFCFVDDDVSLRPHSLNILIPYVFQPEVGVAFGLPCFTNWQTVWSSLVSGLINAHMLLSFVALTYLTDPFRINGHIFAFRRAVFMEIGGFDGLEQYIDDEYEIARRVQMHHLRAIQTPLIYDIDNALSTRKDYSTQFKRWFVMPRQAMMPSLTPVERVVASISSVTLPIPSLIAMMTLLTRRRAPILALTTALALFGAAYALCEKQYLLRATPGYRWWLLPIVALWSPVQIIWTLLLNNEVEWRGQRLRLLRGGKVEIMS